MQYSVRSTILSFVLLVMMMAQVGLAQHATVHFTDHSHIDYHHNDGNDGDQDQHKNTDEACQICLSAKAFSHGLLGDQDSALIAIAYTQTIAVQAGQHYRQIKRGLYNPRAPPTFLI